MVMEIVFSLNMYTQPTKYQHCFEVSAQKPMFSLIFSLISRRNEQKIDCINLLFCICFIRFLDAQTALQNTDSFYIFDHFDTFFSIIERAAQLQISQLVKAIEILYRTTDKLGQMLHGYLRQETLDRQSDYLNLVKMVMYLLVGTVRAIDVYVKNNLSTPAATARGKNKKNVDDNYSHYATYDAKRLEVLVQVCNFMDWQFERLWNLSIAEENFIK